MDELAKYLPHINASLNSLATVFLVAGLIFIRGKREIAHRNAMMAAFGTSVVFLACYLLYHGIAGSKKFPSYPPPIIRYCYLAILLTHIVLAATVPFLAVAAIYFGWRDRRQSHRRVVRWAFPVWLYVSISGVVVYLMLYQLYPPQTAGL